MSEGGKMCVENDYSLLVNLLMGISFILGYFFFSQFRTVKKSQKSLPIVFRDDLNLSEEWEKRQRKPSKHS
jgi:hypothetical protein